MKLKETTIRSKAKRHGYIIRKSKADVSIDNVGGYMLVDGPSNTVVIGSNYDATLEDIAEYLKNLGE